jgi:hypothetical protein
MARAKRVFSISFIAIVTAGLALHEARAAEDRGEARMRKDITVLASDEFEGRGVTTQGINRAADYVADAFRQAGLKPANPDGSYFQPFTIAGATLGGPNAIRLRGPHGQEMGLKIGDQFQPHGMAHSGKVHGPLVFAGYGITASGKEVNYDDYAGVDVTGKVVIILRDTPNAGNRFLSFARRAGEHSSFTKKMQNALKHQAAAVLFVNDRDTAQGGDDLLHFGYTSVAPSPAKLPAFHVRRAVVDALLQSAGTSLAEVEQDIDRGLKPHSFALPGWTADLEVNVHRGTVPVKNVVGVLEGRGPLAQETVVIGAHYDHLGYGGPGSLARGKKPAIHHGADDNGSGTTALLELARRFGALKDREGRRLVFIAFSGEELGLYGSVFYCKKPLFPLEETAAMVNLDMVGRLRAEGKGDPGEKLIVYGTGTAKTFNPLIDTINGKYGFRLHKIASGFGPSDQDSFYRKKIPVFFFFTGDHADYHRPSDTADKINVAGMRKVVDFVEELVRQLAQMPERPQYVKVAEPRANRPEGRIPRLGIRPEYGDSEEGVLLSGVSDGGPAARAGLKEGDRIMAIGGKPVKDLQAYMALIAKHKVGQPVELGVLRAGKALTVKVVPE